MPHGESIFANYRKDTNKRSKHKVYVDIFLQVILTLRLLQIFNLQFH